MSYDLAPPLAKQITNCSLKTLTNLGLMRSPPLAKQIMNGSLKTKRCVHDQHHERSSSLPGQGEGVWVRVKVRVRGSHSWDEMGRG